MIARTVLLLALAATVASCGPDYSPDTYASSAVQQANKVDQGIVVGVRDVAVTASGVVGAVSGGAAGGIAGSQVGVGPASAFSALGGTLLGGLAGTAAEHVTADTKAFEYIVRKTNGDLLSVTQKDTVPLALGQNVLVIAGSQARVVPDYTVNENRGNPGSPTTKESHPMPLPVAAAPLPAPDPAPDQAIPPNPAVDGERPQTE